MKTGTLLQVFAFLAVATGVSAAQLSVVGGLSYDHDVRPGEKYEGAFSVKNDSNEPQETRIYQRDYSFFADGRNFYDEPGSLPRSNAAWIAFSPTYIVIPPHSSATVTYQVSVPVDSADQRLIGSYWSMLMVEPIPPGSPESSLRRADSTSLGLLQTVRYGIQIATHIENTGTRAVRFLDAKLVKQEAGERVLQVDIENSGDRWIRPDVHVELYDAQGVSQGKIAGAKFRMYPGTSVRQAIPLGSIPAGTYKALVVVDAGGDDVFGAQYTLQF